MSEYQENLTDLAARFVDPPVENGPVPMWWWSGEPLDRTRLRWQLEELAKGGVGGAVVMNLAPTGPLYGSDADDPAFFSDEWWDIFRGVCADARELGVPLYFYDQIGFSGANIQATLVTRHSEYTGWALERVKATGRDTTTISCPPEGEPLGAWVQPLDDAGRSRGAAERIPVVDRQATWAGDGQAHRVMLCYAVQRGFNYLDPGACRALLETIHGQFDARVGDYLGTTIVGSFQDELPTIPTWSQDFARIFVERFGYDLLLHLIALFEDNDDASAEAAKVRHDYHALRAALAEEAFFRPLHTWHEERGLLCGVDQQDPARGGEPVDTVQIYADYQRTHRWYGAPGSDHHGDAKIHSSLAHFYDRPHTWVEAFHSTGWGGTLEETFDWLLPWLRAGATLYNPHAVYYSTRGGWWEWAPPSTCWRQPYWRHYPLFADTVRRLSAVLSAGHHMCDIGVLFPSATVQSGVTLDAATSEAVRAHGTYLEIVGTMRWYQPRAGALDLAARDFDVLDDTSIQDGRVEDGRLRIGAETFAVVVLPACTALEERTAARLSEFVEAGGRVIAVGALPARAAGRGEDDRVVRTLGGLLEDSGAVVARADQLAAALADVPTQVEAPVPTLLRRAGQATVLFVPAAFPRATEMESAEHEILPWFRIGYRFDAAAYQRNMTVTVRGVSGDPQLWEPYTGRRRRLPGVATPDGVTVTIPFDESPCALLVWNDPSPSEAPAPEPYNVVATPLLGPWRTELGQTLDNEWGDLALPAASGPPPVQCWEVEHRIGSCREWSTVQATFGPHGQWQEGGPDGTWHEAVYSDTRGLHKDRLHEMVLGPKGHVPEEYLEFGRVAAGESVRFRSVMEVLTSAHCHLAVGAAAGKRVWVDGCELTLDDPGYLAFAPVQLAPGPHVIELVLQPEHEVHLRAHLALVTNVDAYRRPEWMTVDGSPMKDVQLTFTREFGLPDGRLAGAVNVASPLPCRLKVNGIEIGRQGGFDPYFETQGVTRLQTYDVGEVLRPGINRITVELANIASAKGVLVDARFTASSAPGDRTVGLMSDTSWQATCDGQAAEVVLRREQWGDPAAAHLWHRPHPLPGTRWIEGDRGEPETVVPALFSTDQDSREEWLRFLLPAGTERMRLPVYGKVDVLIDEAEVPYTVTHGNGCEEPAVLDVAVPAGNADVRHCVLRVETARGRSGGAILAGPVEFGVGVGEMQLGDWSQHGLAAYSGGIRYRTTVHRDEEPAGRLLLDLGEVRGTAEVHVDGRRAGVRIWSPYAVDLTDYLSAGTHELEIRVDNTLAPYIDAVSPTHYVFSRQRASGLFGPVRLIEISYRSRHEA